MRLPGNMPPNPSRPGSDKPTRVGAGKAVAERKAGAAPAQPCGTDSPPIDPARPSPASTSPRPRPDVALPRRSAPGAPLSTRPAAADAPSPSPEPDQPSDVAGSAPAIGPL